MIRFAALVLGISLVSGVPLGSALDADLVRARPGWSTGELVLEASRARDAGTASIVRAKSDAQADLESRVAPFQLAAVRSMPLDSSRTVGELAAEDSAFFASLHGIARAARPDAVFLSTDLARLTVRWTFPLFGERGITGSLPIGGGAALRRPLGSAATRAFTGLVIHAQGPLPVVGAGSSAALVPALFPRIWDENMDLVLGKDQLAAAAVSRWGMVGYLDRLDEEAIRERAGADPLRVAARAIFGRLPVDVVIPVEAARRMLSVASNVEALRQGRVCIVCDRLE